MFISYAQNCEDVLLFRALRNVEQGRYIDVGAADPISDSVTLAFYQRGWRGINIEPSPLTFKRLAEFRPDDINLNIAAGNFEGLISFFMVQGADVLSTISSEQLESLAKQGFQSREIQVPVRRLESVLRENPIGPVHFLKIDVEGFERAVLTGADLRSFRPWVILIEATAPNSQVPTHDQWEDLLIAADYCFVWFDGLNRYYVSSEKIELAAAFQVQPNVFDQFKRHSEALAIAQLSKTNTRLAEATARQQKLEAELRLARAQLATQTLAIDELRAKIGM
jgi:FkbM family methyltransferase